ncbi:hypothetical protein NQ318_011109 [Aromia moschata]|uniref:FHA domain-containing protein n=1 Tax=Aromia moschata TaxID=1265417 RepID=A0AAV8YU52_9CUCU|nr:hypothetical protein NQ318_011109 [Aromia moschata]
MLNYLENVIDGSVFYLVNKDQFIVGRKECDFLISNDQSISRKHAIIRLKDGKITLEDCGSRYHTLCNGNMLTPNVETQLNLQDEIQFGIINSKYRVKKHSVTTTGTRLNSAQKIQLKSDLATIGGRYVENWNAECTHLTIEEITLTVKVLHAIIDEKPIVKPAYWSKFAENVNKMKPPPDINEYNKPPIAEALLNNVEFSTDPRRRSLFKGKLFVFSKEKTKKQMEDVIRKAVLKNYGSRWNFHFMGKGSYATRRHQEVSQRIYYNPCPDSTDDSNLNDVVKHFSNQGKRTIPLQEIAMSIVLCSCEKDCNPSFNRVEQVFPMTQPIEPTQSNALVPGSQSQYFSVKKYKEEDDDDVQIVIPDTIEAELVSFKKESKPSTSKSSLGKPFERSTVDRQDLKRLNKEKLEENPSKKTQINQINTAHKRPAENDKSVSKMNESRDNARQIPSAFISKNKKSKVDTYTTGKNDNPFKLLKMPSNALQVSEENPFKSSFLKKKRGNDDDLSELSIYTVIIEVMTQLPRRPKIYHDDVDGGTSSRQKHNFKRFMKVKPLKPQRTILGRENFALAEPDITGMEDTRRESHFSDDEVDSNTLRSKKKAPKKFLI